MKQENLIAESNFEIAGGLVNQFAKCYDNSMSFESRESLRSHAIGVIERHIETPIDKTSLASMYDSMIIAADPTISENMCMKKYILVHEGDMSGFEGLNDNKCRHCGGFGTYETNDPQAWIKFCGDYNPVEGKL